MATSTDLRPSVRAAFAALVDYAGLFPPAKLTLDAAQREYAAARTGAHAWILGRFIVPARLLTKSSAKLVGPFSAIVDSDLDALKGVAALRDERLPIEAIEVSLRPAGSPLRKGISDDSVLDAFGALEAGRAAAGIGDLPAFVEIPRADRWMEALPAAMSFMSRAGLGAKLRCGGLAAEAFPSVDEVAGFIAVARAARVPFKATAGLHHPVRHIDRETGFTMHGFLNLIAAASLAPRVEIETLRVIVAEEDRSAFAFDDESFYWREERVAVAELEATRRDAFIAYGSCSFADPVDDLAALGLLNQL